MTEQDENEARTVWTGFIEADGRRLRMFGFGDASTAEIGPILDVRYFDLREPVDSP